VIDVAIAEPDNGRMLDVTLGQPLSDRDLVDETGSRPTYHPIAGSGRTTAAQAKAASVPAVGENAGKNWWTNTKARGDALALTEHTSSHISEDR
jgi:hypothetical protein